MAEMEGGSAMNSISGGGSLGGSGSETTMMEASLPMDWEERRTKNNGENAMLYSNLPSNGPIHDARIGTRHTQMANGDGYRFES